MQIHFYKYQGEGNDFILLDNRNGEYSCLSEKQIHSLCDRRFGVGADGVMLLESHHLYDFTMKYYNSDGKEGSMCGNGGRCIVAFAKKVGSIRDEKRVQFEAFDGYHEAYILNNGNVSLKMQDVLSVEVGNGFYYMDTGSPHYVTFIGNVDQFDTFNEGRAIRYNKRFADAGTNVNFVQKLGENKIAVLTYERGVEDETFACGTGTVAAALATAREFGNRHLQYDVIVKGGNLKVSFDVDEDRYVNIWLTGGATFVFQGTLCFAQE